MIIFGVLKWTHMDIILLVIALILLLVGIAGSIVPFLPGVPLSWVGLLLFYLTSAVPLSYTLLGITLAITIIIFALQYIIPAYGAKYFGGSSYGMWGATFGLIIGIFLPIPGGIIVGSFLGAFVGEILNQSASGVALKAAFGSFLGLLASTFMELVVAMGFLFLFLLKVWQHHEVLF